MKTLCKILLGVLGLATVVVLAIAWMPVQRTTALPLTEPEEAITLARGEYLMRAGDCMACHTAEGGEPFAGGHAIESPLGAIWVTNITPDAETGIGRYTLDDFRAALYDGLRRDGVHLYPAMPYENYRMLSEADVRALYQYFMQAVPPVRNQVAQTRLPFPYNQRWGLRVWNWMALGEAGFTPVYDDAMLNRGAYLVQALAHCAACHSPRTQFMMQDGVKESSIAFLSGGTLEGWSVPDLRGADSVSQRWSIEQMAHYLATGRNGHASAVGAMRAVVSESLQYLTADDHRAIAMYLKHISGGERAAPVVDDAPTETQTLLTRADPSMPLGARLYLDNCAACHFVDGKGAAEIFPSLDGNALVNAESPAGLIHVILHGADLPSTQTRPMRLRMQGFGWRLSDEDVAALASFVRQGWHNRAASVTAAQVAPLR